MSTLPPVHVKMASALSCPVEKMSFTMPPIRQGKKENFTMHLISAREARNHQFQMNIKEMSKEETARYRHSNMQSACTAMLREGYHKAFAELFALIEKLNALREAAGPGSAIWLRKSLEEQPQKLDQLQHFLTRTEAAQRAGQSEEVYKNQLVLAQYFRNGEDNWLSRYFFESCLNTARLIKVDGGRKEAEANANLGKVNEEEGQLEKAAEHYEAFYHLTLGRKWTDETCRTHNSLACENLWRIYTSLADKMLENKEHQQAIKSLIKALQMAKEGADKQMEGASAYRLGLAYLSAGSPEKAISTLNTYKEISEALDDLVGLGKAYEAIAKSLQSQGKLLESIQYMEKFVDIAKGCHLCQSLIEACTYLGAIYNTKGDYEKAFEYFKQAYEAALSQTADPLLLEEARVHYSTARAHAMMVDVNSHIEAVDPPCIQRLVTWKEIRRDTFTEPFPVDEASDDADDEMEPADGLEDKNTSAAESAWSIPLQHDEEHKDESEAETGNEQ